MNKWKVDMQGSELIKLKKGFKYQSYIKQFAST